MTFLSIEPFVPSGSNYEGSKQLFQELGFHLNWEQVGLAGFEHNGCKFILQDYNVRDFAENYMLSVRVDDIEKLWQEMNEKQLQQRFGVRITAPTMQPYGKEVILIDIAGVCWHFIQ